MSQKTKMSSRRRHRRTRSRRHQRGGYSSAATYGMEVNGTGPEQYARTFSMDSQYAGRVGSEYVGAQGQWGTQTGTPTAQQLSLVQSAGTTKRGGMKVNTINAGARRRRRGGFLGPVISQAIVPATILGMQQTYGRKPNYGNKTFRNKRFSRRR